MKLIICKYLNLILAITFFNSCYSQKNINFYYQDKSQATKNDSIAYKYYLENTSEEKLRKENEILLFFNNDAFKKDTLTINGKSYSFDHYICGYSRFKVLRQNIEIESKKKGKIELKPKDGIDFIILNGDFDNKWGVTFSEFYPVMICE